MMALYGQSRRKISTFRNKKRNLIMTNKVSLLAGVLALATVSFVSAKSYTISFSHAAKAGSLQLSAGEYDVKVQGGNAVFTDMRTHKSVSVPVKVENSEKKFAVTAVDSTQEGDAERVNSIQLGGSTTKLDF
jgi:hypothetical protein